MRKVGKINSVSLIACVTIMWVCCSPVNAHNNSKRFMFSQLGWLGIYMVIALAIIYLLPFPVDMILLFGIIFLITHFRRRVLQRYSGKGRIRNLFGLFWPSKTENQLRQVSYYCMSCGKEHNDIACPNCGSKMKRVG